MRKFIFSLFISMLLIAACKPEISAQSSKLWLGLSSDVTSQPISDVTILPSVLFFPTSRVAIGGSGFYCDDGQDTYKGLDLRVRVYPTQNLFVSGGIMTTFETNGYLLEAGYTSFFGKRFYMEPSVRYFTIDDTKRLSIAVGVGVRL